MKTKPGVFIQVTVFADGKYIDLAPSPQITQAMQIADSISKELTGKEIVITSIIDGKHSRKSKHYTGNAFDIRVWIYTEKQIHALVAALKKTLGKDYDVIFEGDHIHIEYDPK